MALRTRSERPEGRAWRMTVMRVAALEPDADHAEALRIRASFGRLARDLAASRSSCAAARESVGPLLANL